MYIENGVLCIRIREHTSHLHIIEKSKRSLLCLLTWRYYQPSLARTTPVSNYFDGPKGVGPIEVLLFFYLCIFYHLLHGPSIFAVKAKIFGVLYNQSSSITFDETSSYWSALKSS